MCSGSAHKHRHLGRQISLLLVGGGALGLYNIPRVQSQIDVLRYYFHRQAAINNTFYASCGVSVVRAHLSIFSLAAAAAVESSSSFTPQPQV